MTGLVAAGVLAAASVLAAGRGTVAGEVVEAVVALVNDDIITKTELMDAEQVMGAEITERFKGPDLGRELARAKDELLKDMITKKMLVQQAERLYDLTKMEDAFIREFKQNNKLASNAELEKLLKGEGMTLDEFKKKLVEVNAPGSVIQYEVREKISVSEAQIEEYYQRHAAELASPERVSFREIVLLAQGRSQEETMERAQSLLAQARGGADFEQLAGQSSEVESTLRGGLLGPFKQGELAPELEAVVFAMKPGEFGGPVVIGHTVHVIRLEGHEASVTPTLESVREQITSLLERQSFETGLKEYIESLWDQSHVHVPDLYVERIPLEYRKYLK
jgi:parvulin-like peptidyl-prolyl isomerase